MAALTLNELGKFEAPTRRYTSRERFVSLNLHSFLFLQETRNVSLEYRAELHLLWIFFSVCVNFLNSSTGFHLSRLNVFAAVPGFYGTFHGVRWRVSIAARIPMVCFWPRVLYYIPTKLRDVTACQGTLSEWNGRRKLSMRSWRSLHLYLQLSLYI